MLNPYRLALALSAVLWWAKRGLADFAVGVAGGEGQATKPVPAPPLSRTAARQDIAGTQGDEVMAAQRCSVCAVNYPLGTRSCPTCGETTWYSTSNVTGASGMAAKSVTCHDCGNCGAEAWGYTQGELLKDGWTFHSAGGSKSFALCAECAVEYAARREAGQAAV